MGRRRSSCADTSARLSAYRSMLAADEVPEIMFGFYQPDCYCPDSAQMTVQDAAEGWEALITPLAEGGTVLGSPSMCKQKDEDFLIPFNGSIVTTWDVTSVHINKPNLKGVKQVVEHYWSTYKKPVWVSEFACVADSPSWKPCTDQNQIDAFIWDVVTYLEGG